MMLIAGPVYDLHLDIQAGYLGIVRKFSSQMMAHVHVTADFNLASYFELADGAQEIFPQVALGIIG